MKVSGATDASVGDLVKAGTVKLEKVKTVDLPAQAGMAGVVILLSLPAFAGRGLG